MPGISSAGQSSIKLQRLAAGLRDYFVCLGLGLTGPGYIRPYDLVFFIPRLFDGASQLNRE